MPKKGFKSVTVSEDIYDQLAAVFKENRAILAQHGVLSMAGFFSWLAFRSLKNFKEPEVVWDSSDPLGKKRKSETWVNPDGRIN